MTQTSPMKAISTKHARERSVDHFGTEDAVMHAVKLINAGETNVQSVLTANGLERHRCRFDGTLIDAVYSPEMAKVVTLYPVQREEVLAAHKPKKLYGRNKGSKSSRRTKCMGRARKTIRRST